MSTVCKINNNFRHSDASDSNGTQIEFSKCMSNIDLISPVNLKYNKINRCGILSWRPCFLEPFRDIRWFLAAICFVSFLQASFTGYMSSQITTLEKRFAIRSIIIGVINTSFEIGYIFSVLTVCHIGSKGSIPFWIACGLFAMSAGSFLFSLPHFLSSYVSLNNSTSILPFCHLSDTDQLEDVCIESSTKDQIFMPIFVVAYLLVGAGSSPILSLAPTFVDDHASPKKAPVLIASVYAAAALGPLFGYALGAAMLKFHANIMDVELNSALTPDDPNWIGAWWCGYIILGIIVLFGAFVLLLFPSKLRSPYLDEDNPYDLTNLCNITKINVSDDIVITKSNESAINNGDNFLSSAIINGLCDTDQTRQSKGKQKNSTEAVNNYRLDQSQADFDKLNSTFTFRPECQAPFTSRMNTPLASNVIGFLQTTIDPVTTTHSEHLNSPIDNKEDGLTYFDNFQTLTRYYSFREHDQRSSHIKRTRQMFRKSFSSNYNRNDYPKCYPIKRLSDYINRGPTSNIKDESLQSFEPTLTNFQSHNQQKEKNLLPDTATLTIDHIMHKTALYPEPSLPISYQPSSGAKDKVLPIINNRSRFNQGDNDHQHAGTSCFRSSSATNEESSISKDMERHKISPKSITRSYFEHSKPIQNNNRYNSLLKTWSDFLKSLNSLIWNKIYIVTCVCICCEMFLIIGFVNFLPKYIETEYQISKIVTSIISGFLVIPAGALGILLGGVLLNKLNFCRRYAIVFVLCVNIIILICVILFFFLGCDNPYLVGFSSTYPNDEMTMTSATYAQNSHLNACSSMCHCAKGLWKPVCHRNSNIAFPSPCQAGCTTVSRSTNVEVFSNCSCLPFSSNSLSTIPITNGVYDGLCPHECKNFIPFIFFLILALLLTGVIQNPLIMVTIRSVRKSQRSFALGLQFVIIRLFAYIPSPVAFGKIIDNACLFWNIKCGQPGSCSFMDLKYLAVYIPGLAIIIKLMAISAYLLLIYYLPSRCHDGEEINDMEAKE